MAEVKKPAKPSQQQGGKKPALARYNNENHQERNKKARAERHKRLLDWRKKRRDNNPGYVLPSKIKRFAKRHSPKPAKKVEVVKEAV